MSLWKQQPSGTNLLLVNNFGGVKRGDMVALCGVIESLRQEFGKPYRVKMIGQHPGESIQSFFQDYFFEGEPDAIFPFVGDVWTWYDVIYYATKVQPQTAFLDEKVLYDLCVCPLQDAWYHLDRNWSDGVLYSILEQSIPQYPRIVVCTPRGYERWRNYYEPKGVHFIIDDLDATYAAIRQSNMYLGGDTGTTHWACLGKLPQMIGVLYGSQSNMRHNIQFERNLPLIERWLNIPVDFQCKVYYPHTSKICAITLLNNKLMDGGTLGL